MKFIIPGTIYFVYLPVYLTGGSSLRFEGSFVFYTLLANAINHHQPLPFPLLVEKV